MNNKYCPASGFSDATSKLILTAALAGLTTFCAPAAEADYIPTLDRTDIPELAGYSSSYTMTTTTETSGTGIYNLPDYDPTTHTLTDHYYQFAEKPGIHKEEEKYENSYDKPTTDVSGYWYDFNKTMTSSGASGVAFSNTGALHNVIGDYVDNKASSTSQFDAYGKGAALYNSGTINNLYGDFISNTINGNTVSNFGTGIYNSGTINSITGNFLYNTSINRGSTGIGVYNEGYIKSINANFIGDYCESSLWGANGSAITSRLNGKVDYISGNFLRNHNVGTKDIVGIILNSNNSKIGTLDGNFIENIVETTLTSSSYYAGGGGISNSPSTAQVTNIYGQFVRNKVKGYNAYGGAIYNEGNITNISAYFDGNNVEGRNTQGGAIRNTGTITNLTGTFTGNHADSTTNSSYGGAIYNTGTITNGIKNSTFTNNYVSGGSGGAIYTTTVLTIAADDGKTTSFVGNTASSQGGAIWASNNLTFNANNGTITFQDNKANNISNAIYFSGSRTANFNISNGGSVYMYDKIAGSGTYSVVIKNTGGADSTGTFYMYNDMTNANVTTKTTGNKINIDLSNDETKNVSMRTLSSDNTALYKIDFDISATPSADAITTTTASSGTVYINDINFYGLTGNEQEGYTQTARILNTPSNALQLGINDALTSDLTLYSDTVSVVDDIVPNVRWNQEFGGYDDTITLKGGFNLDTTSTTSDSLTMTITDRTEVKDWTDKYDTLKAWSEQTTTEDRNFNFAETGVDPQAKEYVVTKDLSTATAGNLNINGEVDSEGTILSVINAQDTDSVKHQLFTIGDDTTLTINNVEIKNAKTDTAAITNTSGVVNLNNVKFTDNTTDVNNSKTLNITGGTVTINNGISGTGTTDVKGGTLIIPDYAPLQQGILKVTSGTLKANASNIYTTGNTVENSGTVEFTDGINSNTITGNGLTKISGEVTNSALISQKDLTVTNTGTLTSKMSDLAISSNTIRNDGNLELTGANEITLDITKDTTGTGVVKFNNGNMKINSTISGNTVEFTTGTLTFVNPATNIASSNLTMNGGAINLQNGTTEELAMQNLDINSNILINMDSDITKATMDSLKLSSFTNVGDNKIKINPHLPTNVSTILTNSKIQMSPISKNSTMSASDKINLASSIDMVMPDKIVSPIYIYKPTYNNTTGIMTLSGGGGGDSGYNPAVLAEPAVAQAQIMQVNNIMTNYAFHHVDTCMGHQHGIDSIHATRYANKYAIAETDLIKDDLNTNNPLFIKPEHEAVWFKPFASFENIPLRNGPNVKAINYGALVGYDSQVFNHKHGWDGVWTGYVGYTGSNMHYSGVDSTSNGGLLGATYSLYKGNFFNATTLTAGAMNAEARTMYGNDHMTSLYGGIGNKTGYNINFKEGLFTLQPSLLLSYTFGKTFDYTNSAGVRINSDPIHAIQVSPGLKFFMSTKNGWQPYLAVNMMWNIMDRTHVRANNVSLPNMSVKPYIQYGVGLQKVMKDHFTAYGQAMIQNGGRNGISLTAGFKWALGSLRNDKTRVYRQDSTKTVIKDNKTEKTDKVQKANKPEKVSKPEKVKNPKKVDKPQKVKKIKEPSFNGTKHVLKG